MTRGTQYRFQSKLDALTRQQHVSKPLLDLLHLLVANATDSDEFKQQLSTRIAIVEGIARQPTDELNQARVDAVRELQRVQETALAVELTCRNQAKEAESLAEMRLRQVLQASEDVINTHSRLRQELAAQLSGDVQRLKADITDSISARVAEATAAVQAAAESMTVAAQEKLRSLAEELTATCEEACRDAVAQVTASAAVAQSAAGAAAQRAGREMRLQLQRQAEESATFLGSAVQTLNTMPLLDAHMARAASELCNARLSCLEDSVQRLLGGSGITAEVTRLRHDASLCAHRLDSLTDQFDLRVRRAVQAHLPSSPSRTDSLLMKEVDSIDATTNHALLGVMKKLDVQAEASITLRRDFEILWESLRSFTHLVDETVVERIDSVSRLQNATLHVLGLKQELLLSLFEETSCFLPSGATPPEEIQSDRITEHRLKCAALLMYSCPVLVALHAPLPPLGIELRDGDQPLGGVAVMRVCAPSIGKRAGLLVGDVILKVNGAAVNSRSQFAFAIAGAPQRLSIAGVGGSAFTAISNVMSRGNDGGAVSLSVFRGRDALLFDIPLDLHSVTAESGVASPDC